MKGNIDETMSGPSRRGFLKGIAAGATGLALAGVAGGSLSGCANESQSMPQTGDASYPYATYHCDVLVIGGGMTGKAAARMAVNNGASVIVIEKGKFGHSGNSTSGRAAISSELSSDKSGLTTAKTMVCDLYGIADQEYVVANVKATMENPMLAYHEQCGTLLQRYGGDDAMFPPGIEDQPFAMGMFIWAQTDAQDLIRRGIDIHDYTMMVDIITDDSGHAAGAVAIDQKTGQAVLYRAKSVILATSSFQWAQGQTCAGPYTTGDGHYVLMKRGIPMRDLELNCVDIQGGGPYDQMLDGPDQGWTEIANCLYNPAGNQTINKDGETFMAAYLANVTPGFDNPENYVGKATALVKEVVNGKGTQENPAYVDLETIKDDPVLGKYVDHWLKMDDGTYDFSRMRLNGESFGSGASPKVDYETFETEIPGIYSGLPSVGSFPSLFCWGAGHIAGTAAAKAAAQMELPSYDEDEVQAILAKSYSLLDKEFNDDSIRPVDIIRNIQGQFAKNLLWIKNEEGIQGAIDEFLRIRKEDLPRMAVPCKTKVMNREWRNAMEVESMLAMSLGAAYASLERKETRPMHYRTDYPKLDNENYFAHLWVSIDKDGNYSVEKQDIDCSQISRDEIIAGIGDVDINVPNPE